MLRRSRMASHRHIGRWQPLAGQPRHPTWATNAQTRQPCVLHPQLTALTELEELDASVNPSLGEGGPDALAPLAALSTLRKLDLSECGLKGFPQQVCCRGASPPGTQSLASMLHCCWRGRHHAVKPSLRHQTPST